MTQRVEIDPAWSGSLRAAGLSEFDAFMQLQGGPPASRHRHRETLPVEIFHGGEPRRCFLKRVFWIPPKHCLVPLFRLQAPFSQPRREWIACRSLLAAGLPVMQPIAWGERRAMGVLRQAFILVAAAPMAHTAEEWLVPGIPKPRQLDIVARRRLLFELGLLVRRLDACGFAWPDASAKHVFAAPMPGPGAEAAWRFCIIDVERMTRPGGAVSPSVNLLPFVESLSPMAWSRVDAVDFLGGWQGHAWTDLQQAAVREVVARRNRREGMIPVRAPRLPDDYVHPRYIEWQSNGKVQWVANWQRLLSAHRLTSMDGVFGYADGEALNKPGLAQHRERLRLRLADGVGAERIVYLKRYRHPPAAEQLRRMREAGRHASTASRERRLIKRLSSLGIPTLDGICFGEEMAGSWERRSFSMTAAIDGISLEALANRQLERPALEAGELRGIARQLAALVGRLHRGRLFHRDLYLCHVFLTRSKRGGVVLRLIDLGRMLDRPRRTYRWQIKDLAALNFSTPAQLVPRASRLRFLYDYLRAWSPPGDAASHRRLIRRMAADIDRRSRRLARHERGGRREGAGRGNATDEVPAAWR